MKKFNTRNIFSWLIASLVWVNFAYGQTIYQYANATNGAYSGIAANVTATGLSRINCSAPSSPCGSGFSSANMTTSGYSTSASAIEFTVTPNSGYAINVTSFTIPIRRSNTGPAYGRLAYSVNGGSTWVDQGIDNSLPTGRSCGSMTTASWTVSITSQTAIKFRVFAHSSGASTGTFQVLNATVSGTVTASGPVLNSANATNVIDTSAQLNANFASDGGTTIQEKGFVWSTSPNPTVGGSGVTDILMASTATGLYDTTLTEFPAGTKIYFKGYAKNSGGYYYSNEANFITISREPKLHATNFTATAISKNSIQLNWDSVPGANGYLVIQRIYEAPTGTPADRTGYTVGQTLGDGSVAAIVTSGTTTTATASSLIQGTRYYYTLFPLGFNGTDNATYNYKTDPTIPVATDSTLGAPPSRMSVIAGVNGSEISRISSIVNGTIVNDTQGVKVWQVKLMDGGLTLNDPDDLPTTITRLVITTGPYNQNPFNTTIQAAALFDDSTGTLLANAAIAAGTLTFNSLNVTAQDNNFRPLSLRIALRSVAQKDTTLLQFRIDSVNVTAKAINESSQIVGFSTRTDSTRNKIDVIATRLNFQVGMNNLEVGAYNPSSIYVDASDAFGSRDLEYTGQMSLTSSALNMFSEPRTATPVYGMAAFDTVRFHAVAPFDTLIATAPGMTTARSVNFRVENSKGSLIATRNFYPYSSNINYLDYRDTATLTTANSLEVFGMTLLDGGITGDKDFSSTTLTSLTINVSNWYMLRKAALFYNGTKIGQADTLTLSGASRLLVFNGLNIIANDDDSAHLSLHMTFLDSINDLDRISFNVTAATSDANGSVFGGSNAGGAVSPATGDINKVDIIASRLLILQEPSNVARGTVMYPSVSISAVDTFENIDRKGRTASAAVTNSSFFVTAIPQITMTNGTGSFNKLIFSVPADSVTLTLRTAGLDSVVTDTFEVMQSISYRTRASGNWSDTAVWEYSLDHINWANALEAPNFARHGEIIIRTGDTVQMDGNTPDANTVDETLVEQDAVLITPAGAGNHLVVNDALGHDLVIEGWLVHNNSYSVGGVDIFGAATLLVTSNGTLEMNANDDAQHWAGNKGIIFENAATYIHRSSLSNSITPGVLFPNADEVTVPVFVLDANLTYPGTVNTLKPLVLNGVLDIVKGRTLTFNRGGERQLRNGIRGKGDMVIVDSALVRITGLAELSDTGKISVNNNRASLEIAASSYTNLNNNRTISSSVQSGLTVSGVLNGAANELSGTAAITMNDGGTVITSHAAGVDGIFHTTGNKQFNAGAQYEFNGNTLQQSGHINSNTARNVWVNNTAGVSLDDNLTITDTLYLGQGNLNTTATNKLFLPTGAAVKDYSAASFVNGPVAIWVDTLATVFAPIGKNTYGPVTFLSSDSATAWITLEYFNHHAHTDGFDSALTTGGLTPVKANEYWTIGSSQPVGGQVNIEYTALSNINGAANEDIRVISWNGSNWTSEGPAARTATATEITSDKLINQGIFTIGIDSSCVMPNAPAFLSAGVCEGNDLNLRATGDGMVRWYINASDNAPFATGDSVFIGQISADTIFYADVKHLACISNRVAYPVTFNLPPVAPVVTTPVQICYQENAELVATVSGTAKWYNSMADQTPVFTGDTLITPAFENDTLLFVEQEENGCISSRVQVEVKVRARISAPFAAPAEACVNTAGVIRLSANESIRWFADDTTSTSFFTGNNYHIASLQGDSTYYAEAFEGRCHSDRVPVSITALARPADPVANTAAACEGNATIVSVTSANDVFWYNDATSTIYAATGDSLQTPVLFSNRTYYAESFDGKCYSANRIPVTATVFAYPASVVISLPATTPASQNVIVQTSTVAQNYEWNFGAGAVPATATGAGPHNVMWNTQGVKTIKLKVWNGTGSVECANDDEANITVLHGLSVDKVKGAQLAYAYPNPVTQGELFVNLGDNQGATLTATDLMGKVMWSGQANTKEVKLQTADWSAGVYLLHIQAGQQQQTIKIIVQ